MRELAHFLTFLKFAEEAKAKQSRTRAKSGCQLRIKKREKIAKGFKR